MKGAKELFEMANVAKSTLIQEIAGNWNLNQEIN